MPTIDFCFDVISPFAHVAARRLDELPGDVTLGFRPILFGPVLARWGQLGPAEIGPKRLHTYRLSCFLAGKHGVPMRFPPRHPFNSLAAMRLLAGLGEALDAARLRSAFDFVFVDGRAPDTPGELAALAERLGVDPALAADDDAKTRLRANTEDAIARGVFGVPTFIARRDGAEELFWGVDAFDMLLAWLGDDKLFDHAPYADLASVEVAVVRKPAG